MPAMRASSNHRAEQVSKVIHYLCSRYHLYSYVSEARRSTDIIRLSIWGERQNVLKLPFRLLEYLPDEDIEILQSGRRGGHYLLLLVITERLIAQSVTENERRAKLHGRLADYYYPGFLNKRLDEGRQRLKE